MMSDHRTGASQQGGASSSRSGPRRSQSCNRKDNEASRLLSPHRHELSDMPQVPAPGLDHGSTAGPLSSSQPNPVMGHSAGQLPIVGIPGAAWGLPLQPLRIGLVRPVGRPWMPAPVPPPTVSARPYLPLSPGILFNACGGSGRSSGSSSSSGSHDSSSSAGPCAIPRLPPAGALNTSAPPDLLAAISSYAPCQQPPIGLHLNKSQSLLDLIDAGLNRPQQNAA